uniref:polyphenol oxidase latent form, chloroplastic-like n=1 Tax=Erigeron canadensis TaxID=72917 RepID=UPI001CB9AABE|nr:polyphenol oxidase latent form, chloroplastic-like [Erigeron canadensis]
MSSSIPPLITSSLNTSPFKARTNKTQVFRVSSCKVTSTNDNNDHQLILPETQKLILPNNMNVDRRNLLVGLGGVCTAANLASLSSAFAAPIEAPDVASVCKVATSGINPDAVKRTQKCCPPSIPGKDVEPFKFPKEDEEVRMRWPAHKADQYPQQVQWYKDAIKKMRDLPDNHPHSFVQQASIHCAYCNGGYTQELSGFPDVELQIHNSWLFFPFHRWYLYFYERILGNLIGEPTFALPYWNWDDPAGMQIPNIFLGDKSNPLYDEFRNTKHLPPALVDLALGAGNKDQEKCNLITVHRDLITNAVDDTSFFGGVYVAGNEPVQNRDPSVGSVEAGSHTAVHVWVGRPRSEFPNGEDMGNFYSAGYDPLFYVHHTNVDRMWKLWKDLCLPGHVEPAEEDWLNASYVFYDENLNLVRVSNRDSVNIQKLKFDYAESNIKTVPWRDSRPDKRNPKSQNVVHASQPLDAPGKDPLVLKDKNVRVRVGRPERPNDDYTKGYKEILFIDGIAYKNTNKVVSFDVFVNDEVSADDKALSVCDPEYAGGFAQIAHGDMSMPCGARFGLDDLLANTNYNTKDGKAVVVKLVPKTNPPEEITIKKIEIKQVPVSFPFADTKILKTEVPLPVTLGNILKVRVDRPQRTDKNKESKEILIIKGIYPDNKAVKFDVFVNDKVKENTKKEDIPTPCSPEYAGRFARVPLNDDVSSSLIEAKFELDKLFRDTKTENQKEAVVALLAKTVETRGLSITDIKIELVPIETK